jgi:HAD superfamily hydrolase (TIGR01490 family)
MDCPPVLTHLDVAEVTEASPIPGAAQATPVLAIFDLDGTLTRRDTYVPFLLGVLVRYPLNLYRTWTLIAPLFLYLLGKRSNGWLKDRFLYGICNNAPRHIVDNWSHQFGERVVEQGLRQELQDRLAAHRACGHRVILATASLDLYVQTIAKALEFDAVICTTTLGNSFRLDSPNCYGPEKLRRVAEWKQRHEPGAWTVVYTDHHADLPLLDWADHAVVVAPTPRLLRYARANASDCLICE